MAVVPGGEKGGHGHQPHPAHDADVEEAGQEEAQGRAKRIGDDRQKTAFVRGAGRADADAAAEPGRCQGGGAQQQGEPFARHDEVGRAGDFAAGVEADAQHHHQVEPQSGHYGWMGHTELLVRIVSNGF